MKRIFLTIILFITPLILIAFGGFIFYLLGEEKVLMVFTLFLAMSAFFLIIKDCWNKAGEILDDQSKRKENG